MQEALVNVRIDSRLIHGQVVTMWCNRLQATRIMVVDDAVVKNDTEKQVLRMAAPAEIRLSVLSAAGAARRIGEGRYEGQRVMLIVRGPETIERLREGGVDVDEVTVGNISPSDGSVAVTKSINVNASQRASFERLDAAGVRLVSQMVPNDAKADFMSLLKEA